MSHQAGGHQASELPALRRFPFPGSWVSMDGAPGARARGNWDILVLGMGKGGPRCAERWLVLMLAPAQPKSLPPPSHSPQWSAASPFPLQRVWLLLALISCALSPSPCHHSLHIPPPSVHHTARLPVPQRLRPTSLLCKRPRHCSHASQLVPLMLRASLCSPLQRALSHPKVPSPLCPQCGCIQRGGMETSRPAQGAGTGARMFVMALAVVVPRRLLAAKKYPGKVAGSMGRAQRSSKSSYWGTPAAPGVENHPTGCQQHGLGAAVCKVLSARVSCWHSARVCSRGAVG